MCEDLIIIYSGQGRKFLIHETAQRFIMLYLDLLCMLYRAAEICCTILCWLLLILKSSTWGKIISLLLGFKVTSKTFPNFTLHYDNKSRDEDFFVFINCSCLRVCFLRITLCDRWKENGWNQVDILLNIQSLKATIDNIVSLLFYSHLKLIFNAHPLELGSSKLNSKLLNRYT